MRVLAFDPGTIRCGYGVVDAVGGRASYAESGTLHAKASDLIETRTAEILRDARELLDQFRPDVVAIETQFAHPKYPMSGLKVAAMRGALTALCMERRIQVRELTPAHVKRMIAGRGMASKKQVQSAVKLKLALNKEPSQDAADALAIALAAVAAMRMERRAA